MLRENSGTDKKFYGRFDFFLLAIVYTLIALGVLFISVATYNPSVTAGLPLIEKIMKSNTGSWQAIFMLFSPLAIWVVTSVPYVYFKRLAYLAYLAVLLLLIVAAASQGIRSVTAWISIFLDRMLQPAEFAKIVLILVLANALTKTPKPLSTKKSVVEVIGLTALPAILTLAQKETGSVLVMAAIFFVMLFFSNADWKWWASLLLIGLVGIGLLFGFALLSGSESYRLYRILSFLDPVKYAGSAGLQVLNSQEAIGSGGLRGIGFFIIGSHSQLNFVPEDWTDFIFASVGEAVGFIGTVLIVVLYLILILRMIYLAKYTKDDYGRLIIFGVVAMLFFHIFQNIAMTVGLMPITGIPLPFLSYGGSNLMTNVVAIALVLNVTKNRGDSETHYVMKIGEKEQGFIKQLVGRVRRKRRLKKSNFKET